MKPFTEKEQQIIDSYVKNPNLRMKDLAKKHGLTTSPTAIIISKYFKSIQTKSAFSFKDN